MFQWANKQLDSFLSITWILKKKFQISTIPAKVKNFSCTLQISAKWHKKSAHNLCDTSSKKYEIQLQLSMIKWEIHAEVFRNKYFGIEYFDYEHDTTLCIRWNTWEWEYIFFS